MPMPADETPLQRLRRQVKYKDGDTRGIAKAFVEVWDADGSGTLTRQEFLMGLKTYGVLVNDMTEAEKKALWKEFDNDGSGSIDVHEFLLVLGEVYQYRMQLINEAFDKLDADGSGEVSIYELSGREDVAKYFDNPQNPDGIISRMEFASYCSAISSACESDEDFRRKMEELTDVETTPLPSWVSIATSDPSALANWANTHHPNPQHVMGGLRQGVYHAYCRPGKRSVIKGCFTYDAVVDGDTEQVAEMRLVRNQGTGVLLDLDDNGRGHFLKVKTQPKRGTRAWYGKQRVLSTTSLKEAEEFLNELQPQPHNIQAGVQGGALVHLVINDVGAAGFAYKVCVSEDIPHALIAENKALILGFNTDGLCLYLLVPALERQLTSSSRATRSAAEAADAEALQERRTRVRNPRIRTLRLEGIYDCEERARELFNMIDIDNTGVISNAEFMIIWDKVDKCGLDDQGLRKLLQHSVMDTKSILDQDTLTFDEFCVVMFKLARW